MVRPRSILRRSRFRKRSEEVSWKIRGEQRSAGLGVVTRDWIANIRFPYGCGIPAKNKG